MIDASKAAGFAQMKNRREVVRPLVVEKVTFDDGTGGNDAGDLALDDFPRDRITGLLGNRDALSRPDQLGDVIVGSMVGHATHRHGVALGQGDVEDGCGGLRVVEEHLVEIAEAVEEQHVGGQRSAHRLVLRHHRGKRRG